MRSILLSNIPHYHHLAEALHGAGMLQRYVTSATLMDGERAPAWLPRQWRRKLEGRRLATVPRESVRQIRFPEFFQRGLPRMGVISHERGDWLNNHWFDKLAERWTEPCDIFHFVSSVGLYCARKAKALGAKVVCDVRQEHPAFQRRMLEEEAGRFGLGPEVTGATYESKVLEEFDLADFIVLPSAHAKRTFLSEGFSADRLITIPYGVDLDDFHPAEGRRDSVFRVVYAGSLTLRKGPQYLLEALAGGRLSNVDLVLVGPIDPAFKPILARYEGSFRYLGVLPKLDLRELFASASAFVLPSLADSFSLATLEAMACGLPVIITHNTGAADVVEDGRHGFVVPIRSPEMIRQKIAFLRDQEELRIEMGRRAGERARTMSWERYGAEAVGMYRQIEAAGRRAAALIL